MATIEPYATAGGLRYRVRYRTPDHRQTTRRGFSTKRDAEAFLHSVEVSKLRGEFIDATAARATIGELGDEWLKSKEARLKPSSFRPLQIAWRVYVRPRWGSTYVGDVRHSAVSAWVAELAAGTALSTRSSSRRASKMEAKPKSATTVLRAHGVLAGVLDVAVKDRRITSNPCRGLDNLPRKSSREHRYLNHDELTALAEAAGEHGTLVLLLGYCGLRWGEVSALRRRDVDLNRRRLTVAQNAVLVGGVIELGTPKSHERRSVPFPALLTDEISRAIAGKNPDELVFGGSFGGYLRRPNTSAGTTSWFLRALSAAGLERMGIHDLRHTAASLSVSAGANVKAVQRMLGHKSAAMTLDVYADLFDDDLDAVSDLLNQAATRANVVRMWSNTEPSERETQ